MKISSLKSNAQAQKSFLPTRYLTERPGDGGGLRFSLMCPSRWRVNLCWAILLTLSACDRGSDAENIAEPRLRPVRYHIVSPAEANNIRTFSGLAKIGQESDLSFRVGGVIQSTSVKVGDQLQPGQLIAELDASQYQLEVQQALASLSQAEAGLRNARANFERVKGLYENNNASRNDLDSARAAAESNTAQVSAARKAVELARLHLQYTRLNTVDACSVAALLAEVNENVSAGQTIVQVACSDRLEIDVAVPESVIALIQRDMDAAVTFSAIPDKKFNARVTEVGVAAVAGATYPVTVTLVDRPAGFRSGLAAQVAFAMGSGQPRFMVPTSAVGEDTSGRYVYIVDATDEPGTGMIRRQAVTTGELTAAGLEIIEGVDQADKVVTAGVSIVWDGLRVSIE